MSDLEARIAEVLGDHNWQSVDIQGRITCQCEQPGITDDHEDHLAAMLAPVFREAQSEAWISGYIGGRRDVWPEDNPYRSI